MRIAERATSIAAVVAALSTLACCLPFGFLGAVGLAGLSVWAQSTQAGFLPSRSFFWSLDSCSCIVVEINAGSAARSVSCCSGSLL